MANFFKSFGKGVLYVLCLPLLVVVLAIYAVVGIGMFIYLAVKGLILFFTGRSLYEDLPEDKEAKKRLDGGYLNQKEESTINVTTEGRPIINSTPVIDSPEGNEVDPFYVPDYLKTPEQEEALAEQQEAPLMEEEHIDDDNSQDDILPMEEENDNNPPLVETSEDYHDIQIENEVPVNEPEQEEEEVETISIERSNTNKTIIEINELEDDDNPHSGVDITFDD